MSCSPFGLPTWEGCCRSRVCQLVRNSLRGECPALSSHSSAGPGWLGVCLGCRVTRRSGLGDSGGGSAAPGRNVGADTGTRTHGCDVWHTCITPCDIRLEHPEGVEPCSARLGRPATRPACWNAKSPGTFPCWGLNKYGAPTQADSDQGLGRPTLRSGSPS